MISGEALEKRIKEMCRLNGISVSDIERHFEWSPGLVSRWKSNSPSFDKVMSIADYFGISISTLVGDERNDKPPSNHSIEKITEATEDGKLTWAKLSNDNTFGSDVTDIIFRPKEFSNSSVYFCGNEEISYIFSILRDSIKPSGDKIRFQLVKVLYKKNTAEPFGDEQDLLYLLKFIDSGEYAKAVKIKADELEEKFLETLG